MEEDCVDGEKYIECIIQSRNFFINKPAINQSIALNAKKNRIKRAREIQHEITYHTGMIRHGEIKVILFAIAIWKRGKACLQSILFSRRFSRAGIHQALRIMRFFRDGITGDASESGTHMYIYVN